MGDYSNVKPTNTEHDIAFSAIMDSAKRFGVVFTVQVMEFVEHEALVKAHAMAISRMQQNVIHEATERGAFKDA